MEIILSILEALDDTFLERYGTYAEDFQFQDALQASLNTSTYIETPQNNASSSQICCQICTEDRKEDEMFQIQGCSHSFCSVCTSKYVDSKLQDNVTVIKCPGEDCRNIIIPSSCKTIILSDVIDRWELDFIETSILPSEKYYCPYNDCSVMLLNDNDEGIIIRESECPNCRRLFCANCNVPWHHGLGCDEFKRSKPDKEEKKKLSLLAKEKNWKKCPNCKVFVDKTEGCIHITCRCKIEFCYICGSNWNEVHWTTCQG